MRHKVELCGVDTNSLPVLTNEEMKDLFERMQSGEKETREMLIQGNLKLVLSVMQRFHNRGEFADDLFQVGCIGLMKSIDNFDLSHNVRFSTYAVPMIIGEIRRRLRDNNPLRVSRSLRDTAYKALQAREQLLTEKGNEPTAAEIGSVLGITHTDVAFAMDALQDPVSLFEPIFGDGGDPVFVVDQIKDETVGDEEWLEEIVLKEGIDRLNEREKSIIQKRFFQGKTQVEVAEEIGISQAQVSRLEKSAMAHIKKRLGGLGL